jgi:hypothetical protein
MFSPTAASAKITARVASVMVKGSSATCAQSGTASKPRQERGVEGAFGASCARSEQAGGPPDQHRPIRM